MPYIDTDKREFVNPAISDLLGYLKQIPDEEIEGVLNYTITEILTTMKRPIWRYKWINRVMGVLESVKFEFYRRLAGPYEDKAIEKNGDIIAYE